MRWGWIFTRFRLSFMIVKRPTLLPVVFGKITTPLSSTQRSTGGGNPSSIEKHSMEIHGVAGPDVKLFRDKGKQSSIATLVVILSPFRNGWKSVRRLSFVNQVGFLIRSSSGMLPNCIGQIALTITRPSPVRLPSRGMRFINNLMPKNRIELLQNRACGSMPSMRRNMV